MKLNKDDIYGIAGSVAFHLFILLILGFTVLKTVVPDEDGGILVNFGNVNAAAGTFEPKYTGQEPPQETTPPPPPVPEPKVETPKEDLVTQEIEESVAIEEAKKKKEKEEIVLSEFERKEIFRNRVYKVLPVIAIILLILLWVAASSNPMSKFPSPGAVWERYLKLLDRPIKNLGLLGHIWASLRRVFIALGCAWLIGISFGILIGWNKKCNALFGPIFTAFRAVPPLAWVPLMTIWFGTGEFPKVLIVFIGALMPVVVNTQAGISNVIKEYLDIGTIFHANERQMLFEIAIPSALDAIFAGIRNSTSAGWMVVLAAEMLGGKSGVGFLIVRGMDSGDYPLCLLSMICIGVVGYLLAIVIQLLERIICPWTRKKSA